MTTRTSLLAAACAALALIAAPTGARAQGSLSVQGLGYPPGQFGARSQGTGGALAEVDPTSTVNPAALIEFGSAALSVQMAPEFRRVTDGGKTANSSTQRFPVFVTALPLGDSFIVGVSSSTLLDRSWQTTSAQQQLVSGDTVRFNSTTKSDGSVNDFAFTAAYMVRPWMRLGVALHAINGRDVVTTRRVFQDSLRYAGTVEPITSTYAGNAVSAGAEFVEPSLGGIALSYRHGGHFEQVIGDTTIGKANVPDRLGLGVVFTGLTGTVLAVRTAYDRWSALGNIDSATGAAMNSWDSSAGAEFTGPRLGSLPLAFRVGTRWRNLPFPADGHQVHESSYSGGMGFTMAQGRASLDIAAIHATRSANIGISESAWTMSAGLTIRP